MTFGEMQQSDLKKRGWLLTIWLAFMLLANAWTVFRYFTWIQDQIEHRDPDFYRGPLGWALPLLLALGVINILAVIALWFWRKLGFYAFVATSAVVLIVNLILGVPLVTSLIGLVGLAILWWLLQSRWHHFR